MPVRLAVARAYFLRWISSLGITIRYSLRIGEGFPAARFSEDIFKKGR